MIIGFVLVVFIEKVEGPAVRCGLALSLLEWD
jgi:hypothetical protein